MPTSGDYSLYFHIPFCTKKCDYCHFFVLPNKDPLKETLMKGFLLEHEQIRPLIHNKRLVSLYFGGGTPSLFPPEKIAHLISLYPQCEEVTLEVNPETVDLTLMKAFFDAGVNRISMGVQSLDDSELVGLGRTHKGKTSLKAIDTLYTAGFRNISIDLMYDVPGQTLNSWNKTLNQMIKLPITHISLYNLTIEPGTVFFKYKKDIESQLPNENESLKMFQMARNTFQNEAFTQYEISAFAKNHAYSKHNTGYWTGREFLGLGPSAFSYWNKKRFRNIANLNKYVSRLEKQESPVDFEEELARDAQKKELFAINLRLLQGASTTNLPKDTQKDLEKLAEQGLVSLQNSHAKLTDKGILFYDEVATSLI